MVLGVKDRTFVWYVRFDNRTIIRSRALPIWASDFVLMALLILPSGTTFYGIWFKEAQGDLYGLRCRAAFSIETDGQVEEYLHFPIRWPERVKQSNVDFIVMWF